MAKLICKDGVEIQISDETEAELRKAFEPKPPLPLPKYVDDWIKICIKNGATVWPIGICVASEEVTRNVEKTEALIVALQEAVEYCKQRNLGE